MKEAGTTDADKVMEKLHGAKVNDIYTTDGVIRADGLLEHSMYVMQVKTPAESKSAWDLLKLVQTMSGRAGLRHDCRIDLPAGEEVTNCGRRLAAADPFKGGPQAAFSLSAAKPRLRSSASGRGSRPRNAR